MHTFALCSFFLTCQPININVLFNPKSCSGYCPTSRFKRFDLKLRQNSSIFSYFDADLKPESWKFMEGLVQCPANYVPLSPIRFLERAAKVYGDRTSVVYGFVQYRWSETYERCIRLASALTQLGVSQGDVVATLAPNVPAMYELHFAVPMAGGVLCTLNTRYDSNMVSILLDHSEAKIIFVDFQLLDVASKALELLANTERKSPIVVLISESDGLSPTGFTSNTYEYESLLANGNKGFEIRRPKNEWDPISVNYTSGTTSRPKGVVYSHRGAYLNSLATVFLHGIGAMPVYLWTVPMFHCNGWCLTWGVAAQGGTNICIRKVTPKAIFDSIGQHNVTHMGGAPTVLNMIVNSPVSDRRTLPHKVEIMTGGAPPPPQIIFKMEELGFGVSHLYGLTETYGPGTYCAWKPEWDSLPPDERAKLKARQGIHHLGLEDVDVRDPMTQESVPADGKTIGEIVFRGNTVMSGYLKDLKATEEAFQGGWFRSGDLAVKHPDGYIEVKDRLKDIIISGGENISTVEVETVLYSHPAIFEAAVVARPDDHWGQTPCAFVKLKEGFVVSEQDIIKFCRDRLPHYMAPRTVIFEDLPRTSTGKVQKFILRQKAKATENL
ncbi:isovalerate--CoA ligase CCL2 isoform X1 [Ricinus communis]|uniref:isovalerate--CoA ligase CCL2 isoform X1 n=2 Tax=Ricinus communis TaxID=3988 RepID=UPI000D69EDB1|nr:isovalerate--CoA ligase CCL2 isoform X1 [Ricinus communis]|eukprot:XP_015576369.2 probable acyl-activating enzyme 1, peroxisomal isoform X1 [Ricinus communis]